MQEETDETWRPKITQIPVIVSNTNLVTGKVEQTTVWITIVSPRPYARDRGRHPML